MTKHKLHWERIKPKGFVDLVVPVLITLGSLALADLLQVMGATRPILSDLIACLVGVVIAWVVASVWFNGED